ncbi:MAG: type IV pilus modification protein PilV [Thioalkalispiraceae bacterium]|jgi:type IV pilus assembly protein PilV
MNRYTFQHVKKQAGFSLLEVMVALVIFSIGLIGLAGLQSASLGFNHSAYLRSQAIFLAYEVLDQIRANPEASANYGGVTFSSAGVNNDCLGTTNCSSTEMAQNDVYWWKQSLEEILPNGKGSVTSNGASPPVYTVVIQWDDSATESGSSIVIRSEI